MGKFYVFFSFYTNTFELFIKEKCWNVQKHISPSQYLNWEYIFTECFFVCFCFQLTKRCSKLKRWLTQSSNFIMKYRWQCLPVLRDHVIWFWRRFRGAQRLRSSSSHSRAPHSLGGVSLAGTAAPVCWIPPPPPTVLELSQDFRDFRSCPRAPVHLCHLSHAQRARFPIHHTIPNGELESHLFSFRLF